MDQFDKRYYNNPMILIRDVRLLLSRRADIGRLMHGEIINNAFRERLMLAVTAVNRCKYCSSFHSRTALNHGLPEVEVHQLMDGILPDCPEEELPAIIFAQHWAECGGNPEPQARQRLYEYYNEGQVAGIEMTIQIIQVANLSGNTLDYWIYRLAFWQRRRHLPADIKPLTDKLSIVDGAKK